MSSVPGIFAGNVGDRKCESGRVKRRQDSLKSKWGKKDQAPIRTARSDSGESSPE